MICLSSGVRNKNKKTMELGDRVYAAERIMKKRVRKVIVMNIL